METGVRGNERAPGPLRVLFLADRMGYPDGTTHGGTTYFLNTLPALQRHPEVELTACFMAPRHQAAERLEAEGVQPIFLSAGKWNPRVAVDVLRLVRRRGIDLLHTASLKSMLLGRWIARLTGCRAVIHLHDTRPVPRPVAILQRRTARWTDAAIVLSESMRSFAIHEFGIPPQRLRVLHNGMDLAPFHRAAAEDGGRLRRELGLNPHAPLVVVPGRIVPEKGQEPLIRAAPALFRAVPEAMMLVVGCGAAQGACERLAERLGLADRIRFTGYRADMPDVLAAADVVAIPSINEDFGYVALEAMAAGRPVVGLRAGGLPEVIDENRTGLLVGPGDFDAMASAVARLLSDRPLALKLGRAGAQRSQRFTIEDHVRSLSDIYRAAVRSGAGVADGPRARETVAASRGAGA